MDTKEVYREKIEAQLAKWKSNIDGLKVRIEQAEAGAKSKLHDQLDGLQEKRIQAEKMLEELSAISQETWEGVKSGVEDTWQRLTRTAKETLTRAREAVTHASRDEDIRQIAYRLWLDEGCPEGRHAEHWSKAESIWRAQQEAKSAHEPPPAKAKRARKANGATPDPAARRAKPRTRRKRDTT